MARSQVADILTLLAASGCEESQLPNQLCEAALRRCPSAVSAWR